jgi:nucleoside-diphosphate-sugar epimerase
LTHQLLEDGYRVKALTRRPDQALAADHLVQVMGTLESASALDELCDQSDCLVHLAGAIAGRSEQDFIRTNAVGTRNVSDAIERTNPGCRLLYISSLAASCPSLSGYSHSKHLAENIVQSSHLEWLILRPPAIYGPSDPALAPLWQALARGWLIQTGSDQARFSLLHVDDLCTAICHLLEAPWPREQTLCLDDGHPDGYAWRDISEIAANTGKHPVRTLKVPRKLLSLLALLNEQVSRFSGRVPMLSRGKVRELTHRDWVCRDNMDSVLPGWRPERALGEALTELPGWNKVV